MKQTKMELHRPAEEGVGLGRCTGEIQIQKSDPTPTQAIGSLSPWANNAACPQRPRRARHHRATAHSRTRFSASGEGAQRGRARIA